MASRKSSPGSQRIRVWSGNSASQPTTKRGRGLRIAPQKNMLRPSWELSPAGKARPVCRRGEKGSGARNVKLRGNNRLLVYDTDGANPYGRELAALLRHVLQVEVLASIQAEWNPPGVLVRRILPSN